MRPRLVYQRDWGIGWIAPEPALIQRASHALVDDGGVWLIDPVDGEGLAERIAALGEPRGVIQLIDRHRRDCAALARRLGVPLHRLPRGGIPGAPFGPIGLLDRPGWREVALWWAARKALVVAEALGTAPYYRAPREGLGVHPLLRLTPPPRALADLRPRHLLVGHGEPLEGEDLSGPIARAIRESRREIPRWLPHAWRVARRRGRQRA